jgi:hypothetical protein
MLVFRPVSSPIAAVQLSSWAAEVIAGNPTQQTISAAGQQTPLIAFVAAAEWTGMGPDVWLSTESPAFAATVLHSTGALVVKYTIYGAGDTPVDHTVDANDLGLNTMLSSGYIQGV